jgi:hypothetical protein
LVNTRKILKPLGKKITTNVDPVENDRYRVLIRGVKFGYPEITIIVNSLIEKVSNHLVFLMGGLKINDIVKACVKEDKANKDPGFSGIINNYNLTEKALFDSAAGNFLVFPLVHLST